MANIKFSAFTQKVAQADVDFLVGYTGADNVRIAPSTLGDGIYLPLAGGTMVGNVIFNDGVKALFGTGSDLEIYHSTDSKIDNTNGDLYIRNFADDKDIYFQCDDGSGGVENYFFLDGSAGGALPFTVFPDNSNLTFGTGYDLRQYHNGTDSYLDNYEGHLTIRNYADDKDIIFQSDDGAGGVQTYFYLDGSASNTRFTNPAKFSDNVKAKFGDGEDLEIYHDASHSRIDETGTGGLIIRTGDFYLRNPSDEDMLYAASGGAVKLYYDNSLKLETTSGGIQVTDDISIGTSIIHTGDTDTKVSFGTDEIVLTTAGTDAVTVDSSGNVGIGTGTPAAKLSVYPAALSDIAGTGTIELGTGSTKYWDFRQTATASADLAIDRTYSSTSSEALRIQRSTGNVGIGTITPAEKLHVSTDSNTVAKFESTDGNANIRVSDNVDNAHFGMDGGKTYMGPDTAVGGNNITITSTGDVGIGTGNPTAALQVVGLVEYADNAAALLAGLTAGAFYRTGDLLKVVH